MATKKPKGWRSKKHPTKSLLHHELKMGRIPLDPDKMSEDEVFDYHPEFGKTDRSKWSGRVKAARKLVSDKVEDAKTDKALLEHDRGLHPKKAFSQTTGKVRYEGSEIQRLLKKDVADGKHTQMKPAELQDTRPEYKQLDLKTFRDNLYYERDLPRFKNYTKEKAKEANPYAPEEELMGPFQGLDLFDTVEEKEEDELSKKTVKELKVLLRAAGLPVSGTKAVLIQRLKSTQQNPGI